MNFIISIPMLNSDYLRTQLIEYLISPNYLFAFVLEKYFFKKTSDYYDSRLYMSHLCSHYRIEANTLYNAD